MRINEVFEPLPTIEQVIEEDFKSVRDRMLGAAVAGSMAMGIGAAGQAMNQARADKADQLQVVYDLGDEDPADAAPTSQKLTQDEKFLALTIWGEARSHGKDGMRAVGHVIMNRLHSERDFGDSVRAVVRKNKAFSCWNKGDPNRDLMLHIGKLDKSSDDYKMWKLAQKLAHKIAKGHDKDPTNGALFYHTDDTDPSWDDGQKVVSRFANHEFFKTDAKAKDKEA